MAKSKKRQVDPPAVEILEDRITTLEFLKSFHREILGMIRTYTGSEDYTSEMCLQEICTSIQKNLDVYIVNVMLVDDLSQ